MEMEVGSLPDITFGILGLSITIATFLPALVYSYSKDLLKGLMYPKMESDEKIWKRVISFIFTNDLILTQSMIQVFFSAVYGLLIFASFIINFESQWHIFIFTFPSLFFLFLQCSYAFKYSRKKIDNFTKSTNKIKEYWSSYSFVTNWWKRFAILNLSITSICIFFIFYIRYFLGISNNNDYIVYFKLFFVCFLSIVLIAYAVSWLIPLVLHQPLTSEVEDYIRVYEKSKKSETDQESRAPDCIKNKLLRWINKALGT